MVGSSVLLDVELSQKAAMQGELAGGCQLASRRGWQAKKLKKKEFIFLTWTALAASFRTPDRHYYLSPGSVRLVAAITVDLSSSRAAFSLERGDNAGEKVMKMLRILTQSGG